MTISAHILLAVLIAAHAIIVIICETSLRRRIRNYRMLQLFAIAAALLLVPANTIAVTPGRFSQNTDVFVVIASLAALVVQVVHLAIGRLPAARPQATRRVLAVGAHPDDLELACGGTLSRLADSGYEVHTLIMSSGAVGGDAGVRPDEAHGAARLMGATVSEVLDFPDTRLATREADLVEAIEARITSFNPDIIFTHSSNDQHQDHAAVHLATLRAGRRHPAILCYESPSATRSFAPSVFVDIADYVDAKNAAVTMHRNQAGKPYMSDQKISANALFRGSQAKMEAAEAFEAVRVPAFAGVL